MAARTDFDQLVKHAFADATPPLAETIISDGQIEPSIYEGKHWSEISPVALNPWEAPSLTQAALLYYLPAYLLAGVTRDWFNVGPLLDLLYTPDTPWDSWPQDVWRVKFAQWDSLMKRLTTDQKHVIRIWLEILADSDEGKVAFGHVSGRDQIALMLRNYWDQF